MSSDKTGEELKYICRECKDTTRVASDSDLKCIHCNSDLVQEIGVNSSLISIPNVTNDSSEEMSEEMKELESEKRRRICLDLILMKSYVDRESINCKHLFQNQCNNEWLMNGKIGSKPWNKYTNIETDIGNKDLEMNEFKGPNPGYDNGIQYKENELHDNDWYDNKLVETANMNYPMGLMVSDKTDVQVVEEEPKEISQELQQYINRLYANTEQTIPQTPQQTKYPTVEEWTQNP